MLPKAGKFQSGTTYKYIIFQERTVFVSVTLTSVKRGQFYYAAYEASFNIVADHCGK